MAEGGSGISAADVLSGARPGTLYCLVDAAAEPELYARLKALGSEVRCLYLKGVHYEGAVMSPELAAAAPYLLPVDTGNDRVVALVTEGVGRARQILAASAAPAAQVLAHCSEITRARDEEGGQFHFRYFDPRVLRAYLPTCTREEKALFFGPLDAVWAEQADGAGELVCFEAEKAVPAVAQTAAPAKAGPKPAAKKQPKTEAALDYMSMYLDNQK